MVDIAPQFVDSAHFGRLRRIAFPPPLRPLCFGSAVPHECETAAQVVIELNHSGDGPDLVQEAAALALLRGWRRVYVPIAFQPLDSALKTLMRTGRVASDAVDPAYLQLHRIRIPLNPDDGEEIEFTVSDSRASRYRVTLACANQDSDLVSIEDTQMPGLDLSVA